MLYLLTFADVKAVGPGGLESLESVVAGRALHQGAQSLGRSRKGEFERQDIRAALRRVQTRVRRQLSKDYDEGESRKFIEAMPERYFPVDSRRRYRRAFRADG